MNTVHCIVVVLSATHNIYLMFVQHFERVKLIGLFVFDEQNATERSGAERPFTVEIF